MVFFAVFAFLLGAVVGSFLNVVIHRVPRGESVVHPPSRCPGCGEGIRWYDNIPILSWLILRGKCRHCATPISFRYTFVELLTGLLSFSLWFKIAGPQFEAAANPTQLSALGLALPFFTYFVFLCLLVAITFVDLEHYIIPHVFTLPGILLGAAAPWLFEWLLPPGTLGGVWPPTTGLEALVGLFAGGISVLVIYYAYFAWRGVQGIGGGDVTLMAMVGAWLGWPALIFIYFASSMQGTLAAAVAFMLGGDWLKSSTEILGEPEEQQPESRKADEPDSLQGRPALEDEPDEANGERASRPSEEEVEDQPQEGGLAVPFGPFITLATVEHFFLGEYMPPVMSMSYLYSQWPF